MAIPDQFPDVLLQISGAPTKRSSSLCSRFADEFEDDLLDHDAFPEAHLNFFLALLSDKRYYDQPGIWNFVLAVNNARDALSGDQYELIANTFLAHFADYSDRDLCLAVDRGSAVSSVSLLMEVAGQMRLNRLRNALEDMVFKEILFLKGSLILAHLFLIILFSQTHPIGQLTEVLDAQGNKQRYTHDNAGRASKEEHLTAAGTVTRTITYTVNAVGTLTGIADNNTGHADHPAWRTTITVDALQRKTREDITQGSQTVTFTTTYSPTGKKASQSLADGTVVTYAYDQSGGDGKGTDELTAIDIPGTGTISMGHRHWGQPGKITYPGGSQRQNDYDPLLRLKQIQVKSAGQQPLMNWQYRFDAESNITGKQTEYGDTAYGYDSLYRLTQVTPSISSGPGLPTERYTYDKLGNRLTDNNRGGTNTWQYDGNNQLTQSFNADQQAVTEHYDANGSLIRKSTPTTDPYNNQKYLYDAGNRLTEVQTPTGDKIASYQYDPLGRRIRKTEYRSLNGSAWLALATPRTTTFFYTDEGLAAEYQHTGSNPAELKTQYGWEPNGMWGTSPLFLKTARVGETSPEYFYAQNDHLGTPQQLIDQAGNLVWAQRAEAFGKTNVVLEKVENNLRFPGQYYDQETNTHYNYFRDYEPGTGRYVQRDPIGYFGGINLYEYAKSSPLNLSDPTGEKTCGSGWNEPLVPDNPMGFRFSGCCESHDDCYGKCGGPTRVQCDQKFCGCMKAECDKYTLPYLKRGCVALANLYCNAVVDHGSSAFTAARASCGKNGC
ncbi:UNVERIFIED_CONTAM: hypothetical protein B566_EDAN016756 [Ephemera danica]|nr:hypothetical protein B566_EDAN016756 [Ephemera danica]